MRVWRRRLTAAAVLATAASLLAGEWSAGAQLLPTSASQLPPITVLPRPPDTTTSTAPPTTTEPTATTQPTDAAPLATDGPSGGPGSGPTDPTAPPGEEVPLSDGDGVGAPIGGLIPAQARAVIASIVRTPPNDNYALIEGVATVEAIGIPHDDAVRLVFGRFPILGPAHWVDDWYNPRWTGGLFRHHLGLDLIAAYGTPVAAPADGIARIGTNARGGLTVRVVEPEGTFWYLAHRSGVAAGLVDGAPVTAGRVVGYVGDSGNARGGVPHLHLGLYPRGGAPVPPKPVVDGWVADGARRVVELLTAAASARPPSAAALAIDLTRGLAAGTIANPESS